MEKPIKIQNVSVVFGKQFKALDDISLELPTDKVIGFIGPSGAGKTTLIKAIVGRQKLTKGSITVFDIPAGSPKLRRVVSYMTQGLSIYTDLTVTENLSYFVTMVLGQTGKQSRAIVSNILETVDLSSKANSLVGNLSGGEKQRVSLAVALIGSPKVMVLDEPTVGLDPVLREKLWELFAQIVEQGTTLIISSHSMDEASRCDDLVLIRNGKLISHNSPKQILQQTETRSIEESFLKLVGEKA